MGMTTFRVSVDKRSSHENRFLTTVCVLYPVAWKIKPQAIAKTIKSVNPKGN
jgi:hypothetical protein